MTDLVLPCSHCGATCLGTVIISREHEGGRFAIEVDSPTLHGLFDSLWPVDAYAEMPSMFRHYNECEGWFDAGDEGEAYDARELEALVVRIREKAPSDTHALVVLEALEAFSTAAITSGCSVTLRTS